MFEGGVSQSPSKLDANFKTWLLGQTRYVKRRIVSSLTRFLRLLTLLYAANTIRVYVKL